MKKPKLKIAIIGRPNVGKSTLFNRITRKRDALVYAEPGVTRDRQLGEGQIGEYAVELIDTGGLIDPEHLVLSRKDSMDPINQGIMTQAEKAVEQADMIWVVLDGKDGPCHADQTILNWLRPFEKPTLYLINKTESAKIQAQTAQFYELGIPEAIPVSAEHNQGFDVVLERMQELLPDYDPGESLEDDLPRVQDPLDKAIRIAIIGRPNVGKSTLNNFFLEEERNLVTDIPGTTRDSIPSPIHSFSRDHVFVDTAGVRRKGKTKGIEGLSVIKTLDAIEDAHICVLLIDLKEGITDQDAKIASLSHEQGRGLMILGNKLDLLPKEIQKNDLIQMIRDKVPFIEYAPILLGSAKEQNFSKQNFFQTVGKIEKFRRLVIPTATLNQFIQDRLRHQPLPMRKGKRLKVYYVTQAVAHNQNDEVRPSTPTFVFFMNEPNAIHFSDERFLKNILRDEYEFYGNPIHLVFKKRESRTN